MQGFKDFLLKGNVIELAVAVIIGAAFKTIVDKFVEGIVNPLLGLIVGQPNFDEAFIVSGLKFGLVLTAIINFVLTAAVIYFFLVRPAANYMARKKAEEPPPGPSQEDLLTEIRDALRARG